MRILITGGAGFIGSHLARRLLADGHELVLVDDLSTGRRDNVAELLGERCELRCQRVGEALADDAWMQSIDAIYHLAAAVGVQLIVDEPVHTIETNVLETSAVLRSAARFGTPVLLTSSSEVYGKSSRVPFSEDDDVVYGATCYNRWSYAATKAIDEYLALNYHKTHELPVVIVRLFNTIGPGQIGRYGMVVPRFIERALADKPIEIYGDGQQTRCFCHVSDVVGAMVRLLSTPACCGRVYNLGSDEEVTIDELADRIIALTGSSAGKRYVDYQTAYGAAFDDLRRRVPDLDRIRQAIGFEPTCTLDQMLRQLIDAARDQASSSEVHHA